MAGWAGVGMGGASVRTSFYGCLSLWASDAGFKQGASNHLPKAVHVLQIVYQQQQAPISNLMNTSSST